MVKPNNHGPAELRYGFLQPSNSVGPLELAHPEANDPSEPYQGVNALFNADLHSTSKKSSPRKDWVAVSPYIIELVKVAGNTNTEQGDDYAND